jgi:hypothetical protein
VSGEVTLPTHRDRQPSTATPVWIHECGAFPALGRRRVGCS